MPGWVSRQSASSPPQIPERWRRSWDRPWVPGTTACPRPRQYKVDGSPYVARGRSRETTFQENLSDWSAIEVEVRRLAGQVAEDVAREGRPAMRLTLKVRYAPFFTKTHSRKLREPTSDVDEIAAVALELAAGMDRDRAGPVARAACRAAGGRSRLSRLDTRVGPGVRVAGYASTPAATQICVVAGASA